ncbi:MAG: T9SS type A sorting domain-containing protein [Ferruginibacter sp.]
MKNFTLFFSRALYCIALMSTISTGTSYGQVVDIISNPNTSSNAVLGTFPYAANESIYTESEIGAANYTTAATAIDQVAFNLGGLGAVDTFRNITIWMKQVPLTSTTFSTGTYDTIGYTKVFTGQVVVNTLGWVPIKLDVGFQRTSGNNLQILIERRDGVQHSGFVYRASVGNTADVTALSARRYNLSAPLSAATSLTASAASRAQIRFYHVYSNDAQIQEIYSLGKLPVPFGAPHVVRASVTNVGSATLTNVPVTLSITGANTFSNVQVIPTLASGASAFVSFAGFTPTVQANNNLTISIPNDDFNGNNSKTVVQAINNNTFSYSFGTVPIGAVGFNANSTGDFAVRYSTSVAAAISQVSVNFITGGRPFKVAIWDTTGGNGKPGTLLFSSTVQTSTAGVYVLPILPAVPIAKGDFFVGVQQTGTSNVSFAYQNEDPIRLNTFYLTQPTGGTVWSDLAPANNFRFMIEPKLQITIDANLTDIITPVASCSTGPVNYGAIISNVGLNTINAGTANVTLKIGGANTYTATLTNATNIVSGASEKITFSGVNINNPGTNFDTVFVSLTGDTEQANDTLKTTNISAAPVAITTFPAVENAEATLPLLPYFTIVTGSTPLWSVKTGNYTNADQATALAPHGGTKFFLCDSYGGGNTAGFVSRLSSNCITIPAATATNCGYKLRFWMSHDNTATLPQLDSMYLSISTNNGLTWTRLLPGYQRANAAYTTPGWEKLEKDLSAYAGQTFQIGFEAVSKSGNAFGLDDITIASIPEQELVLSPVANNSVALTKQCDDQGWTYYSNPASPAAGLFAINWDPTGSGANVAAKAATALTIQLDPSFYTATDIPAKKATYTMQRYWNLNAGATLLTAPVNVRFFYDAGEKLAVDNAAATFATTNTGTPETGTWFKTSVTDFVGNAAHVTSDGVLNAIPLTNVNTANNTINGILYAQFNGITSFSGGTYATGVGPTTPLPVTLVSFEVKRSGKINQISWSTSLELNTKKFIIERATDGRNFTIIGEVTASGNSSIVNKYSFSDNTPVRGTNYYRLRIIDIDNSGKYSAIRSVLNLGSFDISIYPNPVKGLLNIKLDADKADKAELVITDVSGKIVLTKTLAIVKGTNLVPVNANKLATGGYVVKITLSDDVVIRKFDKQ